MLSRFKEASLIIALALVASWFCACFMSVNARPVSVLTQTLQPSEIGLWATKENDGVFRIYSCGSGLCGRFVGMQYKTSLPPTSTQGNSQCNFLMLRDFVLDKSGQRWFGKIFDPRNEKHYEAMIWLSNRGELQVRGYLGISLFGETHVWHRFSGNILQNCRLPEVK